MSALPVHPEMSPTARRIKRSKLKKQNGDRCARCGWWGENVRLTLDHIIPSSHGGNNSLFNLQLLCDDCNRIKADSLGFS